MFDLFNPDYVKYGLQEADPDKGGGADTTTVTKAEVDGIVKDAVASLMENVASTIEAKIKEMPINVVPSQKDVDLEQKGGFDNFGDFVQNSIKFTQGISLDAEKKALLETRIGEDGGLLIPPEFSNYLFTSAQEKSALWQRITMLPVSGNSVRMPVISNYSNASDTYYGGVVNYWTEEGGTVTLTTPKFDAVSLRLKDNLTLIPITTDLLQDSPVSLAPLISSLASNSLSLAMDNVFINGDGVGKPLGIMNANCKIAITAEDAQDASTIVTNNILKMYARFNMRYYGNAIWLANQTTMTQLPLLNVASGTAGSLVFMQAAGLSASPYGSILGRPIQYTEFCKTLGTTGDIILVDPTQYLGIEKGAVSTWSKEVYFIYDKEILKLKYRVDGQMWHNKAFTPANGDTLSPLVTLASRT